MKVYTADTFNIPYLFVELSPNIMFVVELILSVPYGGIPIKYIYESNELFLHLIRQESASQKSETLLNHQG